MSYEYIDALKEELVKREFKDYYIDACIEYAERLLWRGLPVIFDIKHLSLLLGIHISDIYSYLYMPEDLSYRKAQIPKKHGGYRELSIPSKKLKQIQRWILDNILNHISISNFAMGFCNKRSIVTNAELHLGCDCVLNIDLKDFFPSVTYEQIFYVFKYYGYTKEVSFVLARLCTYKNSLPQGAPTSPALSNIVCLKLDKRLSKLAEMNCATYSRYADDITISGKANIFSLFNTINKIIEDERFHINPDKTRLCTAGERLEITGLTINCGKVKVPREYIRKFKSQIYYCKKFGPSDHQRKTEDVHSFFKEHMYGKAYFINMVDPELGKKLLLDLDAIAWEY